MTLVLAAKCAFALLLWIGLLLPALAWLEHARLPALARRGAGPPGMPSLLAPVTELAQAWRRRPAAGAGPLLGPALVLLAILAAFAVIPFGGRYEVGAGTVSLVAADTEWGLFHVLAAWLLAIAAVLLVGWQDRSAAGAVAVGRAAVQALSLVVPLALTAIAATAAYGSAKLSAIVLAQDSTLGLAEALRALDLPVPEALRRLPLALPAWGLVLQPIGLPLFVACAVAASRAAPIDPTALDGDGAIAERLGSPGAWMLATASRLALVLAAALATTLYLGGGAIPWLPAARLITGLSPFVGEVVASILCAIVQLVAFVAKVLVMIAVLVAIRATLPRLRGDQTVRLCWRWLAPVALLHLLVVAAGVVAVGVSVSVGGVR